MKMNIKKLIGSLLSIAGGIMLVISAIQWIARTVLVSGIPTLIVGVVAVIGGLLIILDKYPIWEERPLGALLAFTSGIIAVIGSFITVLNYWFHPVMFIDPLIYFDPFLILVGGILLFFLSSE